MLVLYMLLAAVTSYLLGSISFAVLISKLFTKKDVRDYGSGNAGMTNVVRTAGVLPGILTLVFDLIKGAIACAIGKYIIFEYLIFPNNPEIITPIGLALVCGIFAQLGHVYPVFFGFKGGKGVAVTVGIMLVANWISLCIALGIFILIFLLTKTVSKGSIPAAISLPVTTYLLPLGETGNSRVLSACLALVLAIIIIAKHADNIKRIIKGEEKSISSGKKEG